MFKRYHMEHHQFQGDRVKDVDIPTEWEGRFFVNTPLKMIWLLMQPLFYALRPMIVRPKAPRPIDIANTVTIVISDAIMFYFFGWRSVLYLALSTLLGMGFHPVAGHFISEHYVFNPNQETYSYYGSLNYICWNVGYHNEHHDFPRVPGWKLPQVTAIAPEYYLKLHHYKSWTSVLYHYLFDGNMGPYNRVIRFSK
jgi:sphingolipid delta-4 desaturase